MSKSTTEMEATQVSAMTTLLKKVLGPLCDCKLFAYLSLLFAVSNVGLAQDSNIVSDVDVMYNGVATTNLIAQVLTDSALDNVIGCLIGGSECKGLGIIVAAVVVFIVVVYKHKRIVEGIMWFLSSLKSMFGGKKKADGSVPIVNANIGSGAATTIAPCNNGTGNMTVNINCQAQQSKAQSQGSSMKSSASAEIGQRKNEVVERKSNSNAKFKPDGIVSSWIIGQGVRRLQTVDSIKARCFKEQTIIFVVDDKDGVRYEKGLNSIGYNSVKSFPRYPNDADLSECAILIFDVRGVGNAAGADGFSLAKHFKEANPLKKVVVRSGYLTQEQRDNKGPLDEVLDKERDMCEQVDPLLRAFVEEVGNPVKMWEHVRGLLIESHTLKEVALLEHKFVRAINSLADVSGRLPGNWMSKVNDMLEMHIF